MNGLIGAVIATVVGGVLSFAVISGFVSSQTALPAAVDAPYIVYGTK